MQAVFNIRSAGKILITVIDIIAEHKNLVPSFGRKACPDIGGVVSGRGKSNYCWVGVLVNADQNGIAFSHKGKFGSERRDRQYNSTDA